MSTTVSRRLTRVLSTATVVLIVGGLAAAPAFAEPDPPAAITSEAPLPSTPETPPSETPSETPSPSEPAKPVAQDAQPDLKVTATVEPGIYVAGQEIPVNVTLTNSGAGVATKVIGSTYAVTGGVYANSSGWREFTYYQPGGPIPGPGGKLEPGVTENFVLTATVSEAGEIDPQLAITVETQNELNPGDNNFVLTVPVVRAGVVGNLGGVVYGDANENNVFDAGEGLRGIPVTLYTRGENQVTATDSTGRFTFFNLPAAQYSFSVPTQEVEGWILAYPASGVIVDGSDRSADLRVRGERPLSQTLIAKAEFGAKSYQVGAVATVTVTLTNRGPTALTGVKVGCNRYGSNAHLEAYDDRAHWGDLGYDGPGVTLAAGETRVFEAHGDVSQGSQDQGVVYLACDFGEDDRYITGYPNVYVHAKVPGKTADLGGVVYQDFNGNNTADPGEGIPNLRLGLSEWETEPVVAKTTTDVNGVAQFIRLPRGWYSAVVYGPWKIVDPEKLANPSEHTDHFEIKVLPGPDNPDPTGTPPTGDPVPPADGGSGSGSGSSGGLASTGVEVFGPAVGGAAAVFAGILALFYARRLRRNEV